MLFSVSTDRVLTIRVDIYGHASKDRKVFPKSTFYDHPQPEPGIVAERDPERHRDTRKLLSHGFSAKALKEREAILSYYVDLFVAQIGRLGTGENPLNMKQVLLTLIQHQELYPNSFSGSIGSALTSSGNWLSANHLKRSNQVSSLVIAMKHF